MIGLTTNDMVAHATMMAGGQMLGVEGDPGASLMIWHVHGHPVAGSC